MKWGSICVFFLLSAVGMHAQQKVPEHCPVNGQFKNGGNPTISWTSYMVKTDEGICVERSVHTQGQMYVSWPAADMNGLWVVKDWNTKRCCFSDSTVKDGELEYGLLGSKLHTTVYQGHNEIVDAGKGDLWMTGQLLSGNKLLAVKFGVTATSSVTPECAKLEQECRRFRYVVTNSEAPVIVKWNKDLTPEFTIPESPNGKHDEFIIESRKSIIFVTKNRVLVQPDSPENDTLLMLDPADGKVIQRITMPGHTEVQKKQ